MTAAERAANEVQSVQTCPLDIHGWSQVTPAGGCPWCALEEAELDRERAEQQANNHAEDYHVLVAKIEALAGDWNEPDDPTCVWSIASDGLRALVAGERGE